MYFCGNFNVRNKFTISSQYELPMTKLLLNKLSKIIGMNRFEKKDAKNILSLVNRNEILINVKITCKTDDAVLLMKSL